MKNELNTDLIITYGNENITLNKGKKTLLLNKTETAFLLKSLLNNLKIIQVIL